MRAYVNCRDLIHRVHSNTPPAPINCGVQPINFEMGVSVSL